MIQVRTRMAALWERCRAWYDRNLRGTEMAVCHGAALLSALIVGVSLSATYWPEPVGHALTCAAAFALMEVALWLLGKLLKRLLGHGLKWLMALACLTAAVAYTVWRGAGEGWTVRVWLFSALVVGTAAVLAAAVGALVLCRRATPTTISALLASGTAAVLLAVFLFTDGFDNHYVQKFLALAPQPEAAVAALEPSLGPGPYRVETVDYGPEAALTAGTIDLTPYMSRDTDDLTGVYVDTYLEYELSHVPLAGRVWYPAEETDCPVLFIAHGNHEITTESYLGYAYLGEYLASHGYVVVSADHNACNMLSNENDGRAVLLLEHIGLLLGFSSQEDNPLFGRLDRESIAIAGHSRGGEMAATAYLFNGYDHYPENGTVTFDYGYPIKSIIAIAPTVDQYRPSGHSVELTDVNYLLLHGAADRDVTSFMGMAQYENISFSGEGDFLKSALYIAGANHGQFNSLWGAYDQQGAFSSLLNVESLLSQEKQQEIARLFIKVFLDVTLKGDESCRTLLTDWDDYAAQLPETVYVQCYETSRFTPIADFEEDSDLETATLPGASLYATGVNWWTEERPSFAGNTSHDLYALRLRWQGDADYTITLPETDMAGQYLSFDICDRDEEAVAAGRYRLVDAVVMLTDAAGDTATARLSDFTTVYPILPVRTDKLDFLFDTCTYKSAFATAAIPIGDFTPEGEGFDPSRVVEVSFQFEGSGQVGIDNIGLGPVQRGDG